MNNYSSAFSELLDVTTKFFEPKKNKPKKLPKKRGNNHLALHYWLQTGDFTQQLNICSGNEMESLVKMLVIHSPIKATLMQDKMIATSSNTVKEADLLFLIGNVIHYREIKTNMNLDSEKTEAANKKVQEIIDSLGKQYAGYIIVGKYLTPPYYDSVGCRIEGLNDFLKLLGYKEISAMEFDKYGEEVGNILRKSLKP
jgi:hypothetical protein